MIEVITILLLGLRLPFGSRAAVMRRRRKLLLSDLLYNSNRINFFGYSPVRSDACRGGFFESEE
jgi:hypothetical protein